MEAKQLNKLTEEHPDLPACLPACLPCPESFLFFRPSSALHFALHFFVLFVTKQKGALTLTRPRVQNRQQLQHTKWMLLAEIRICFPLLNGEEECSKAGGIRVLLWCSFLRAASELITKWQSRSNDSSQPAVRPRVDCASDRHVTRAFSGGLPPGEAPTASVVVTDDAVRCFYGMWTGFLTRTDGNTHR